MCCKWTIAVTICLLQALSLCQANYDDLGLSDYYNYANIPYDTNDDNTPFDTEGVLQDHMVNPVVQRPAVVPHVPVPANIPAAAALQDFTFKIMSDPSLRKDKNVVVSPISVYTAMALLRPGLNGSSLNEVNAAMGLTDVTDNDVHDMYRSVFRPEHSYELLHANRLYVERGVQLTKSYRREVKKLNVTQARRVDFSGAPNRMRNKINKFVKVRTQDKIQGLLPVGTVTQDTKMVLINALYLKAQWLAPFQKSHTKLRKFYIRKDKHIDVAMMSQRDVICTARHDATTDTDVTVLGLTGGLSMVFVVPKNVGDFSLIYDDESGSMSKKMSDLFSNIWTARGRERGMQNCNVYLPKFTINYKLNNAKDVLRQLGVRSIFEADQADFTHMTHSAEPLYVSDVRHKATIEINEDGVEASAATAMALSMRSTAADRKINKPFMFAIRHDATGAMLFSGKVTRPKST